MPTKPLGVNVSDLGRLLETSGAATDELVAAIYRLNDFIRHGVTDEKQQEELGSIARSLTAATKTIVSSGTSTATEIAKLIPDEDADNRR